jgi:hypothetical protein
MVLSYQYYEIVDPEIVKQLKKYKREKNAMFRRASALAKKVGANPKLFATSSFGGRTSIRRFMFDRNVPEGWTGNSQDGYRPYVKNPLHKEFEAIGKVDLDKVQEMLKFQDIFVGNHMYTFNLGYTSKHFVFRVPIFDADTIKFYSKENKRSIEFKPPRGTCKKISVKQYNLMMAGVK